MQQHLSNNRGDANVSKMTIIAIVFVVGAILLVLTTSAFRKPINHWFKTVTYDWFNFDNGMFNQTTKTKLEMLGVKANTKYAGYDEDGNHLEIHITDETVSYCITDTNGAKYTLELPLSNTQTQGNVIIFEDGSEFEVIADGNTLQTYDPDGTRWVDHFTLHKQP